MTRFATLSLVLFLGCRTAPVAEPTPEPSTPADPCDATQAAILREADAQAAPWSLQQHLDTHFPDRRIAWLMPEANFDKYVVQAAATHFGRCDDAGCFVFVAPAAIIQEAVADARIDGGHDPSMLGQALGLPATSFEGPLRMISVDLRAHDVCVRLPVERDPGVWKCATPEDTDCFKFGGFTSGGVPELMAIDVRVDHAAIELVP